MPDPGLVRNALIAKLGADAQLLAQAVNGVYHDVAPVGMTRFVIVSEVVGFYVDAFGQRAIDDRLFLVEARFRKGTGGDIGVAAGRLDDLLDPQPPLPPATLSVNGYALMTIKGEEPIDLTEQDDADPSIIWNRRGGHYRVVMSTAST